MVESKLSKCATKFDHCICRAYQRHGCGDHDDCETNRFCEKIVSRFVLKILTADIPKMRRPGFDASSPVPVQRHRAIIAVNRWGPVVLPTITEIGFILSFRFVRQQVIAMSVPTRRTTLQYALEERLSFIERITAVSKQSCSGTVPSQSRDGSSESA